MLVLVATLAPTATAKVPDRFFGIAPQEGLTSADAQRMSRGGIESVRVPVPWSFIQPTRSDGFQWGLLDFQVEQAARSGMEVFPVLYSAPSWATGSATNLPVQSAEQRQAWTAFVEAAVRRYGPGGEFWTEPPPPPPNPGDPPPPPPKCTVPIPIFCPPQSSLRLTSFSARAFSARAQSPRGVPIIPIRNWQIWNEPNFFYFATPASPGPFADLVKISHTAIQRVDPKAKVILGGLFGRPKPKPPRGMAAATFLKAFYRVKGIEGYFDGVALHPYASDTPKLKALVEGMRSVMVENRDQEAGFYITEIGWGSQANSKISFEKGVKGQASELDSAYTYLIDNQERLNLKATYWFAWKDVNPAPCTYCDSVGLFSAGSGLKPKPAWFQFVKFTGGRAG